MSMNKKEVLLALQMKYDWIVLGNTSLDKAFEEWYGTAVRDLANIIWEDLETYWFNQN
jgi:hypothetical protein